VTAGAFSVLGAVLYLPALHAERERDQAVPEEFSPAPGS
jgi:hypothetical protein